MQSLKKVWKHFHGLIKQHYRKLEPRLSWTAEEYLSWQFTCIDTYSYTFAFFQILTFLHENLLGFQLLIVIQKKDRKITDKINHIENRCKVGYDDYPAIPRFSIRKINDIYFARSHEPLTGKYSNSCFNGKQTQERRKPFRWLWLGSNKSKPSTGKTKASLCFLDTSVTQED